MTRAGSMVAQATYEFLVEQGEVVCYLELKDGRTVEGRSEFIYCELGDFDIGRRRAYQRAFGKVIDLQGGWDRHGHAEGRR